MILEVSGRRAGKTTKLVKKAKEFGWFLVVIDRSTKKRICIEFDFPEEKIFTFDEFIENRRTKIMKIEVVIDDADLLLQRLTDFRIMAISLTGERS